MLISEVVTIKTYTLSNCTSCITGSTSYKEAVAARRRHTHQMTFPILKTHFHHLHATKWNGPQNIRRDSPQNRDPTHQKQNFWSISAATLASLLLSHSSSPLFFHLRGKWFFATLVPRTCSSRHRKRGSTLPQRRSIIDTGVTSISSPFIVAILTAAPCLPSYSSGERCFDEMVCASVS